MNLALQIIQYILAAVFLLTGFIKLILPPDKVYELVPRMFPLLFIRALATLEVAGAIGMGLSSAGHVLPDVSGVIALGMGLVLLGAFLIHGSQREWSKVPFIVTLLVCSVLIAYFRLL